MNSEISKTEYLLAGDYTVISYEAKNGMYGLNYIVEMQDNEKKEYFLWSNSYLTKYISSTKPTRKFTINVINNKVQISGYLKKVILQ